MHWVLCAQIMNLVLRDYHPWIPQTTMLSLGLVTALVSTEGRGCAVTHSEETFKCEGRVMGKIIAARYICRRLWEISPNPVVQGGRVGLSRRRDRGYGDIAYLPEAEEWPSTGTKAAPFRVKRFARPKITSTLPVGNSGPSNNGRRIRPAGSPSVGMLAAPSALRRG